MSAGLAESARTAGLRAVTTGRWAAETVVDLSGQVPIRDRARLEADYPGLRRAAVGAALITSATRASGSLGAVAGSLIAVEEFLPPAWLTLPLEIMVETASMAAIELKLIGELHEAYGLPVPGVGATRGYALARAWADRRGVSSARLVEAGPALAETLGRGSRNEVIRLVKRRITRRVGLNLGTLAPLLVGAAAGATINSRATRRLGEAVVADLRVWTGP